MKLLNTKNKCKRMFLIAAFTLIFLSSMITSVYATDTFYDIWNVGGQLGIHSGTQFENRINGWSTAYTGPETDPYERAAKYLNQQEIDTINIVAHVHGGGWWTSKIKAFLAAIDNTGVGLKVILDLEPEPTWSQQEVLNNINKTINISKKPDSTFYPSVIGISLDMEYLGGTGRGTETLNKVRNITVNDNPPLKFFPIWFYERSKNDLNGMANKAKVIPLYDGVINKKTQTFRDGHNGWVDGQVKYMKDYGFAETGVMPISYETGSNEKKHSIALKTWFIYKHAVDYAGGVDYFILGSGDATEDPLSIYTKGPILDTGKRIYGNRYSYYNDSFRPTETVYVYGSTNKSSATLSVYVVNDSYPFPNRVPTTETSLNTDPSGKILAGQIVWNSAKVGRYEIIVDVNGNGNSDEGIDAHDDFEVVPPFKIIVQPAFSTVPKGTSKTHEVKVKNNWVPQDKKITLSTSYTPDGWSVDDSDVNGREITNLAPGATSSSYNLIVTNNDAAHTIDIKITGEAEDITGSSGVYNIPPPEEHIFDHPDDSYDISSPNYPYPWKVDTESNIGILLSGWAEGLGHLLGQWNISTAPVKPDLTIVGEPDRNIDDLSVLLIGSASLTGLDNSQTFKSTLADFVAQGGTIIALTAQHGYEFNALPGGEVSGYGWLEDQSCHHKSIAINTYHPILSGQDSVTSNASVDGYFTKYPKNATILLSRTKNGMPAMLMYEFGNGTVIATTAYTDWAYGHSQATTDAKKLVRDMIAWAKSSQDVHSYGAGDTINIPVNITSYIDLSAEKVVFTVIDPDNEVVDTVEVITSVQPYETKIVNFSWTAPSQYGIFHIDYSLIDDEYGKVEQVQDAKMFAVSKYAENPDGWVWQGSELTFAVTSTQESFAYGEEGLLTLHVWNNGDTDRTIRVDYHRPHHGYWEIEDSVEIFAPAHGEGTSVVSLRMFVSRDIFYTYFYDENNNWLGGAKYPIFVYHPWDYIDIETDENEYAKGEDVFVLLGVSHYSSTVTVRVLDPDNSKIFENTFSVNPRASTSFNFTLPVDSERGIYFLTAEAYYNGNKIGSSSTYFKVLKDYLPKINFDKPDKAYRVRENMSINLEVKNVGSALWSSEINISIPVLAFGDSINISLNPNETRKINYNLSIPETTPAGKHDVIVTIDFDNSTKHYSFFIPDSNLILSLGKTSYNAGSNLSLNLTNIGGVDTTYNCSVKFYDLHAPPIYENDTVHKLIMAGENKSVIFKIPDQVITGIYYLIMEYKNLNTVSEPTKLIKTYNINGLEASLATVTDKKVYFNDENVSILTNITNLDGEIVNGRLNLKILSYDSTIKSSSFTKANINQIMPFSETTTDIDYDSSDLMTYEPYRHSIPLNELKDVLPNPASHEYTDSVFDLEPPTEMGNYDYHKTSTDNSGYVSASIASLSSNTWHVPNDYPTILAAVNAASAGDTIIVRDGTYTENINVNKRLTIRSENGSTNCIVNAADTNNHVFKVTANYVNISGFTLRGAFGLYSSHAGIYLYHSEHCNISNNNALNNDYGIFLGSSNNNTLTSNSASNNTYGIFLSSSNNNTLRNNLMSGSLYNFGVRGGYSELDNDIDTSNLVDGKPIYYLVGSTGTVVDSSSNAGTVYCINCNNITVKDLNFSNNTHVIFFFSTNNSRIENVNASNSDRGIWVEYSNNNTLFNNHISNSGTGIYLADSNNNTLTNNHINNNGLGLWVGFSSNNTLENNSASNNDYGIHLRCSSYSMLRNNLMSGSLYNFGVWGSYSELDNDIDTSNLVDGKPIYYLVGSTGTVVDSSSNAGTVYCINCNNITVKDLICTNNTNGIYFFNTTNSRIQSNYINKTEDGIFLYYSYNNTLANNTACSNRHYIGRGIHVRKSNNNILINNTASSSNSWGIEIDYSNNNTLRKNNVSNSRHGIWLFHSINNILVNNQASNNDYGIYLRSSSKYNNIINNTILNNWKGVHLSYSSNNLLYNNYFNNTINAFDSGNNIWNTIKASGTNIVGGPWLGGNYWNDYKGIDIDGDGLGDTLLPYNCSGNIANGGDYLPLVPVEHEPPIGKLIWETNITINMAENESKNIVTDVPIDALKNVTGKLELIVTFYNHLNPSQVINQSNRHSFFITDKDTSLILETNKRVYKPNETITIYGEVQNNAIISNDYNFSIKKEGEEIFTDTFTLSSGECYNYTITTTSSTSFTLEGTANDVVVTDFVNIEPPNINVRVIAPEVVGLEDFDVIALIKNIVDVPADLNISIENTTWNITIPEKESKLIQTTMNITKNTTLTVNISGDVIQTIQKEIICGENAKINLTPQPTYLEGIVEIPYTIENVGILDSKFNATFSIDDQTMSESFFVPKGQNITDSVSFNLTKGAYMLRYTSPFEEVNETINVLSPPEFVVTSILPVDMNFTLGENVTMTFVIENIGGTEGEVTLRLFMPDFEDTNRTWVRPGEKENISFSFIISDDLEEKSYKGIYELDGKRDEFTFFVYGANISVNASLDKDLYEEGETAIFTLDVTNECPFDLSLYARVKLSDYEEVKHFNLTDFETLQFDVPVHFNGQKLFYGIYMESGRALYLNAMYVHKKEIITLYTDKQVYNAGENVTIFIDTTTSGTLNITASGFNISIFITGLTVLEFGLPKEMRSGTYYIDYAFDDFSSAYPFDVVGYSARILECSLDKEVYNLTDVIKMSMNVEVNKDIFGVLKLWIYDTQNNLIDTFEMDKNFVEGENKIEISRDLSTNFSGIHVLVYGIYAHSDLIFLASGAEYFDVKGITQPPVADANGPYIGNEGSPIIFNGSGSYDPDDNIVNYEWDLDGDGIYETNATETNGIINHTWCDDYFGNVSLKVTDSFGATDIDNTTITVLNVPPTADAGSDQIVYAGDLVIFNGSATDPGCDNLTFEWEFGDGTNATGIDTTHIYFDKGNYTVTFTVIDDDGGVGTDTVIIIVNPTLSNVTIKPETLNLKSKGYFTAFITLPEGYDVANINISTVVCKGAPAVKGMIADDGKYIAKFDREDLREDLPTGDAVTLTVIGKVFYNGGYADFEGSDTVRVIDKGEGK